MIRALVTYLFLLSISAQGQSLDKLILRGEYTQQDSVEITNAYLTANRAVNLMYEAMDSIWIAPSSSSHNKKAIRKDHWKNESNFMTWLGKPDKIGMARRRIKRIHSRFNRRFILDVNKEDRGRCKGWISAWAIPFGKTRVVLCDKYFKYRIHLHEKIIIHELGHEVGMLSHRRIHGCWAAQRAASSESNVAKRSPENYAWLAMSYLGLPCAY